MTKDTIAENVAAKLKIPKKQAMEHVENLLKTMKDVLASGENLKLNGFGSFLVKTKNDRKGRNPQTGDTITIASRRVLTFKPSQLLKANINKG